MKGEYILNVKNLKVNPDWTIPNDVIAARIANATQPYLNPCTGFKPCIIGDKITIDEMRKINQSLQSEPLSLISDIPEDWDAQTQKMVIDQIFKHMPQEFLKPEYRKSTNTNKKEDNEMNKTRFKDGAKNIMNVFNKGVSFGTPSGTTQYIIPQITDVKVINNRVVIIKFKDGTQEKAVLSSKDTFSLEQGISICITKKILSQLTYGNGSSAYNKLIDYAMKIYNKNEKEKQDAEKTKEKAEEKTQKHKEKRNKRKAKQRDEQIEILSEAISRAMANFNITVDDDSNNN